VNDVVRSSSSGCLEREREVHRSAEVSGAEFLWVWELERHAVVLGRSSEIEADVHLAACQADGVPVLRRESGGGTVLLGPGCLNYTLVLSCERRPQLRQVDESYRLILDAIVRALCLAEVRREGTDLTRAGRKFAGCSQRRLRRTVLHHGTILYDFELPAVSRYLREPQRCPAHRQARTHDLFLTNVRLAGDFGDRLANCFPEASRIA
jgi:lipoate-protein ligase A